MSSIAFGVDAQATPVEWITWLKNMIPTDASTVAMIGVMVEFLLRYIPSPQPISIVLYVSNLCKHVSDLLEAVSSFLDKIVGQKLQKPTSYYNPPKFK